MNFLVYASLTSWSEPPRSRHQVTQELKKRGTVYFIERNQIGFPGVKLLKVENNVFVLTPSFPIDFRVRYRTPLFNEIYHFWLLRCVKALNLDFEIVFSFDFTSYVIGKYYPNVVYFCGDDYIGNSDYSFSLVNYYHMSIEKKLAAASKLCIVTSDYLQSKVSKLNSNTRKVPLGSPNVPSRILEFKHDPNKAPVLGLVGYLNRRIPLSLIDRLLEEFSVVFIGPAEKHILARYSSNKNAKFVGQKDGADLFVALEAIDVCIAPYDEMKINKGVTPNKLWLYLAMGKPAVVTNIPNIKNWSFEDKIVYITDNVNFIAECKRAYLENDEVSFFKRIQLAKENSWSNRVDQILGYFYNN